MRALATPSCRRGLLTSAAFRLRYHRPTSADTSPTKPKNGQGDPRAQYQSGLAIPRAIPRHASFTKLELL